MGSRFTTRMMEIRRHGDRALTKSKDCDSPLDMVVVAVDLRNAWSCLSSKCLDCVPRAGDRLQEKAKTLGLE